MIQKLIILLLIFISIVYCQPKNTRIFPVTIRDISPLTNPDYEIKNNNTVVKGIVKPKLNPIDRSPVYCCGDNHAPSNTATNFVVHNQSTFHSWFHDVPGVNTPVYINLVFTQNETDPRVYYYEDKYFFPIDGKGFQDPSYRGRKPNEPIYKDNNGFGHNYHFSLEMHASFTYIGGEVFNFKGDDDVWVFIDNKLVIDLGAPHTAESGTVNLDDLGLKIGNRYNFDFFYCERHTYDSYIQITTSLALECKYTDYCGVCEGTGKCCNPDSCYGNLSPCGTWECPPPKGLAPGKDWRYNCIMNEPNCTLQDTMCSSYACSPDTKKCEVIQNKDPCPFTNFCDKQACSEEMGGCYEVETKCFSADHSDPTCWATPCTNNTCQVINLCNDMNPCTIDTCIPGFGCSHIKNTCDDHDHCTIDTCGVDGCVNEKIPNCQPCAEPNPCIPDPTNLCVRRECNPYNSSLCNDVALTDCDDGNLCTTDSCDPKTGKCSNVPVECEAKDACNKPQCNMATGQCIITDVCNDGSICTEDSCSPDGKCINTKITCDDKNKCTNDYCKIGEGCMHSNITCLPSSVCVVASCDPKLGCVEAPVICSSPSFCMVGQCDINYGGCNIYPRVCVPSNPHCQYGICDNATQSCKFKDFDPLPFRCQSAGVKAAVGIGAAATAGIVIGGAAALGLAIFGAKKGYDSWKGMKNNQMAVSSENPLYEPSPHQGTNPLYTNPS
ncbi:hypothetical protein DICPUDRAFT_98645 [Dictyostelium purpureum]|uniref:PA14 domain-containing protein n=1 Tax=Dictyostelium purpureum TaxID=5786 RepID=F0ZSA6_DICPU|nr:uncharacterized protein DICPUDRAFT_98645 [Dictyostelium purpureum]EGC33174.1 hypothetical protein DICPUDRAFT_98645 [Dictyostelium purpureum]|eukprot:XP_003290294.1 hypothetical protein DICPUDRAFT_98645 [Dictyostelium purpureum]